MQINKNPSSNLLDITNKIGNTDISGIADGTITGAIDKIKPIETVEFEKNTSITPTAEGNIIIDNLKGASYQKQLSGKNLLDTSNITPSDRGITYTKYYEDGMVYGYLVNGTVKDEYTEDLGTFYMNGAELPTWAKPSVEYIASINKTGVTGLRIQVYQNVKSSWEQIVATETSQTFKISEQATGLFIRLQVIKGYTMNSKMAYPMITLASETDQTYEPYCGGVPSPNPDYPQEIESVGDSGSVEIKTVGKNLLPNAYYSTDETTNNGLTYTRQTDETLIITGITTAVSTYRYAYDVVNQDILKKYIGKTVTSSVTATDTNVSYVIAYVKDGVSTTIVPITNKAVSFVVPNHDELRVYLRIANGVTLTNAVASLQIELGETATDYEPYTENTITIPLTEPLRAIGDVKDEICIQDGKYGVLRRIGEYVITNDSNITVTIQNMDTLLDGLCRMDIALHDVKDHLEKTILLESLIMSDILTKAPEINKGQGIWINNSRKGYMEFRIVYKIDVIGSTAAEFRTWLTSNPITIHYELATPVFEPFADQTPFYNLKSYNNITNVSIICDNNNLNPSAIIRVPRNNDGALLTNSYITDKQFDGINIAVNKNTEDIATNASVITEINNSITCKECGGMDLNTIIEPGTYVCVSIGQASLENNYPVVNKGYLVVLKHETLEAIQQIYYSDRDTMYIRTYWNGASGGAWGAWKELVTTDAIDVPVTLVNSSIVNGRFSTKCKNKRVTFTAHLLYGSNMTSGNSYHICTIDTNYKPLARTYYPIIMDDGSSGGAAAYMSINNNGIVTVSPLASGTYRRAYIGVTYDI